MDKLIAIIRREYLSRVQSKWFIITTLLAPVLLVGAMLLPILLAVRQAERDIEISIVDESGLIKQDLLETDAFERGASTTGPRPTESISTRHWELRQQVIERELSGYLHIPRDVLEGGEIQFWARDVGQTLLRGTLSPASTQQCVGYRPASSGSIAKPPTS